MTVQYGTDQLVYEVYQTQQQYVRHEYTNYKNVRKLEIRERQSG